MTKGGLCEIGEMRGAGLGPFEHVLQPTELAAVAVAVRAVCCVTLCAGTALADI
jgi:hypothetical protein